MPQFFQLATKELTVSTTSIELLPLASRRDYLQIRNDDANTVFIRFGEESASATNFSAKIVSGQEYVLESPGIGPIQAISLNAPVKLTVTTNQDNLQ